MKVGVFHLKCTLWIATSQNCLCHSFSSFPSALNHRFSLVQILCRFEFVVFKRVLWLSVLEDMKRLPHECHIISCECNLSHICHLSHFQTSSCFTYFISLTKYSIVHMPLLSIRRRCLPRAVPWGICHGEDWTDESGKQNGWHLSQMYQKQYFRKQDTDLSPVPSSGSRQYADDLWWFEEIGWSWYVRGCWHIFILLHSTLVMVLRFYENSKDIGLLHLRSLPVAST